MLVGIDLSSLRLTGKEVSEIFHHAVYDGVYATPEERWQGGSLSLPKHFADWCGIGEDNITGN